MPKNKDVNLDNADNADNADNRPEGAEYSEQSPHLAPEEVPVPAKASLDLNFEEAMDQPRKGEVTETAIGTEEVTPVKESVNRASDGRAIVEHPEVKGLTLLAETAVEGLPLSHAATVVGPNSAMTIEGAIVPLAPEGNVPDRFGYRPGEPMYDTNNHLDLKNKEINRSIQELQNKPAE